MTSTPTLDRFLSEISGIIKGRDGFKLKQYLVIEPPYPDLYNALINDVRSAFSKDQDLDTLESKITNAVPEARDGVDGQTWTPFIKFMVQYLCFLRDVNTNNLLDTYNFLSELVQYEDFYAALGHSILGILLLPTVVTYSEVLARIAIGLDKKPQLIAHLVQHTGDDGEARETLPERCANIIRQAFVTCLNERTSTPSGLRDGKPDSKKIGIYKLANLCLKVLFQCRKTRNAEQIFVNIYNQSPPLAAYPRSERVTYLYYLGRFLFSNNHFFRAQLALESAYAQCHKDCLKQRRLILIYLITSNIILGRFPTQALYERPEAHGLGEKFQPICNAIAKGDLAKFRYLVDLGRPDADWFLRFRILLQLRNRCEVLVWRSLMRKTFLLKGSEGDPDMRKAPTMDLTTVMDRVQFFEKGAFALITAREKGMDGLAWEGYVFKNEKPPVSLSYVDPDLEGAEEEEQQEPLLADMLEVESMMSSLITQGFLNGFISHSSHRFGIKGVKKRGETLTVGFPSPWQVIKEKSDSEVPGWKKQEQEAAAAPSQDQAGPGMVVNLSGARPAGIGP